MHPFAASSVIVLDVWTTDVALKKKEKLSSGSRGGLLCFLGIELNEDKTQRFILDCC